MSLDRPCLQVIWAGHQFLFYVIYQLFTNQSVRSATVPIQNLQKDNNFPFFLNTSFFWLSFIIGVPGNGYQFFLRRWLEKGLLQKYLAR